MYLLLKECLPKAHQKSGISFSNDHAQNYFFFWFEDLQKLLECIFCSCFVYQKELMKPNCISAYLAAEPQESCFPLQENTEQFPASLAFYLKRGQQFIFQSEQGSPLSCAPQPAQTPILGVKPGGSRGGETRHSDSENFFLMGFPSENRLLCCCI